MRGARVGALIAGRADHLGCFELDELLEHELHRLADEIDVTAGAERVEQFGQGRLIKGHRGVLLREPG